MRGLPGHSYQPRPPGEEFLHHGLLEGAGLLPPLLQRRQLPVHLSQHRRDGGLFGVGWEWNLQSTNVPAVHGRIVGTSQQSFNLPVYRCGEEMLEDVTRVCHAFTAAQDTKTGRADPVGFIAVEEKV